MGSVSLFVTSNMSRVRVSVTINCGHLDFMIRFYFTLMQPRCYTSRVTLTLTMRHKPGPPRPSVFSGKLSRSLSLESSLWILNSSNSLGLPRWLAWVSCAPTLTDWLGSLGLPRWLTGLGLLGSHTDWLAWASCAPTLTDWLGSLGLPHWLTGLGLLGSHTDLLAWASCAPTLTGLGPHADWLCVEIYPLK
jgi:hypothetical protein